MARRKAPDAETAATTAKLLERQEPRRLRPEDFLRTGSTLLDLALTGSLAGGFVKGGYFFLVGDSSSGKTFLSLTCLAEAARNPAFADYDFIFDEPEQGALMDRARFFGKAAAERIIAPGYTDAGLPTFSHNIDEFYWNLDDAKKRGRPFIYVLDSMDALMGMKERKKFDERKTAGRKSEAALAKVAGDYGDGKAKRNSSGLRQVVADLQETGSILIIIAQTRDVLNEMSFETKTRAGGRALKFYATAEIWSSVGRKEVKKIKDHPIQQGIICRIGVKKNRLSGKEWQVEFPIYHSYGIDDVGGMVDFLVDWKRWPKNDKGIITAAEFETHGTKHRLVQAIEDAGLEQDLREVVAEVWAEIEGAAAMQRKPRYE